MRRPAPKQYTHALSLLPSSSSSLGSLSRFCTVNIFVCSRTDIKMAASGRINSLAAGGQASEPISLIDQRVYTNTKHQIQSPMHGWCALILRGVHLQNNQERTEKLISPLVDKSLFWCQSPVPVPRALIGKLVTPAAQLEYEGKG